MLALDLFVFHRTPGEVTIRSAALTAAFWISLGLGFGVVVFFWLGATKAVEYFSGYLIEELLSVDNVFVFSLVFAAFVIPRRLQYRVLFWGVIGALVMRFVMIVVGAALIEQFEWILLVFGAFLVFTGYRMWRSTRSDEEPDPPTTPSCASRATRPSPTGSTASASGRASMASGSRPRCCWRSSWSRSATSSSRWTPSPPCSR